MMMDDERDTISEIFGRETRKAKKKLAPVPQASKMDH
jgi:hypothetical protein